jgi:hypothetical protein
VLHLLESVVQYLLGFFLYSAVERFTGASVVHGVAVGVLLLAVAFCHDAGVLVHKVFVLLAEGEPL